MERNEPIIIHDDEMDEGKEWNDLSHPPPPTHTLTHRSTRFQFLSFVDRRHSHPAPFPLQILLDECVKHARKNEKRSIGRDGSILANDGTRRPSSDRVGFLRLARGAIRDKYRYATGGHHDQEHR
jgi:hypothetical protein